MIGVQKNNFHLGFRICWIKIVFHVFLILNTMLAWSKCCQIKQCCPKLEGTNFIFFYLHILLKYKIKRSFNFYVLNVSVTQQEVVLFLNLLKYMFFTACPHSMYNSTCLVNCFTGAYSFDKAKKKTH